MARIDDGSTRNRRPGTSDDTVCVYVLFQEPYDGAFVRDLAGAVGEWEPFEPSHRGEFFEADEPLPAAERTPWFAGDYREFSATVEFGREYEAEVRGALSELSHFHVRFPEFHFGTPKNGDVDDSRRAFPPRPPERVEARVDDLVAFVRGLYERSVELGRRPLRVPGDYWILFAERDLPAAAIREPRVRPLGFVNAYPPAAVEAIGRDHLMGAPVRRAELLGDGAVLLVVSSTPLPLDDGYGDALGRYFGFDGRW